eukprot:TRINITY_DN10797_c0_g2_i2.p1 TRINITY_DN10797_c0_g2~~TRINITY_DN10797_c0_g2_i2.p1  ORF type:complete len:231 (+),score=96.58 TRINITY_DN10797_c0_g2_i2:93-695(+)
MAPPSKFAGLDDELVAKLQKFESTVQKLQKQTKPLTALNRKAIKKYSTFNRARLALATAYTAVVMYIMAMRAKGETLGPAHPVNQQLARVKEYFGKIESSLPDAIKQQERKRVDAAAVKRIVKHDMGREQRQELKEAAKREDMEEEEEEVEEIEEVEEVEEEEEDINAAADALLADLAAAPQPAPAHEDPEPSRKRRRQK